MTRRTGETLGLLVESEDVDRVAARRAVDLRDEGGGTLEAGAGGVRDGAVTIDDLLYFLAAYEAGDTHADMDDASGSGYPDGGVAIEDLLYFLARYEAGC